ncbi:MAG: HlyD family secretion protein [Chlamydiota bacterium]
MTERGKKRGKRSYFLGGAAVLIVVAIGGWFLALGGGRSVRTDDAFIDSYRIDLSPDILGRVVQLKVDEGDPVKQGEIVAVLEQDIFLSQKIEAEAALELSIGDVSFQKVRFEKVESDYIRATKGIRDRIISRQEFDRSQKEYQTAKASYRQALAANVVAKSKVRLIDTYLNHTVIHAPCDGIIAKRWIFTGAVIRPGQALFTMYGGEKVWVQAHLSEKKIEKVRLGDPVEIRIDAYPDKTFYGKVLTIKPAAASQFSVIPQNNATGNYTKVAQRIPLKISLDPPPSDDGLYLFPGMNVEVKIKTRGD